MGKLGKKARKFAKKNLQSVLRERRKKKALFRKRSSSKIDKTNVEDRAKLTHLSNGSDTEVEAFEDLPLDAPFMQTESHVVEDSSDSDGYLSEDISWENGTESDPGKLLEGNRGTSELMRQNIKIQEDLAVKKRKLESLKRKDPSFCKFLERYKDVEARNGEVLSDEDETSNHGRSDNGKVLTVSTISSWCRLVEEEPKETVFVCLLNSYRAACNYGAESIGIRFQNAEAFCSLVVSVLSEADNMFRGLLGLSSSSYEKEAILELKDTPQWVKVRPLIKSYLRSTLSLLDQLTDSDVLAFALARFRASLPFFAAFPYLLQRLIKTTVHLWATGGGMLSSASFSVVRDVASLFSTDCFDNCLKKAFVAYLAQSRTPDIVLRNSFVELCSLDVQTSLSKATLSSRQLAKILQCGLHTKKKEVLKRICSWEYVNCIDLWVGFIAANIRDYDLQPFFFTTVQIINGVVRLFPGPRYFPIRIKCIQWLNELSNSSGIFIPIASFVMDVLEYKIVREGRRPGPALSFQSVLKLPKNCFKSQAFQDECISSAIEQLSPHFLQWSYHISFPELATVPLICLKKFYETKPNESQCRAVKHLVEQVEKNVDFVQRKRDEVAFSPNDHQSVEAFLQFDKPSLCSSFTQYYRSVIEKGPRRKFTQYYSENAALRNSCKSKRKREQAENADLGDKDLDGTKKHKKETCP